VERRHAAGKRSGIAAHPAARLGRIQRPVRPWGEFKGDTAPNLFNRIEDPEDRKFAALAAATGAIVISSDSHLLSCREELPITVLTAREFLAMTGT